VLLVALIRFVLRVLWCTPAPLATTPLPAAADLRAQIVGTLVYTSAFVLWVALFQTQWQKWGTFGTNLLIYVPDSQWWNQ
jgi:hypothetical protein